MATFKVGDKVRINSPGSMAYHGDIGTLVEDDRDLGLRRVNLGAEGIIRVAESKLELVTPAWVRPDYVGTGFCTVPEGVDPESLAPAGAVAEFRGEALPTILAWVTPKVWVRFGASGRMLEWNPHCNGPQIRMPGRKGESVDGWTRLVDWPGLEAWRAQQAQGAPEPAASWTLVGIDWGASRDPDDTLPPQDKRARHCDGHGSGKATAGPDIIPAAVLARRATGYHRGRVSVPTDLTDGLIPDAEPEGIVPRGAR